MVFSRQAPRRMVVELSRVPLRLSCPSPPLPGIDLSNDPIHDRSLSEIISAGLCGNSGFCLHFFCIELFSWYVLSDRNGSQNRGKFHKSTECGKMTR